MKSGILLQMFFLFTVNLIFADTIRHRADFTFPGITKSGQYTRFELNNGFLTSEPGTPELPYVAFTFLLPPGHSIKAVNLISENGIHWIENTLPLPISKQLPISRFNLIGDDQIKPDSAIYNGKSPYPASLIGQYSTQYLCGHSIGIVIIYPLVFYPDRKLVKFISEIEFEIVTSVDQKSIKALSFVKNSKKINQRISEITCNSKELVQYRKHYNDRSLSADLLIITDENLINHFGAFIQYKLQRGIICNLASTQEIENQYQGIDLQEKIRNAIIDQYQNQGISFVILAGDADAGNPTENLVPHRGLFVETYSGGESDSDIPGDLYYACLDGTWNDDNDQFWGEPGEEDLFSEVSIGRICADHSDELQNQLLKIIRYEKTPVAKDLKKGLMLGEMLSTGTFGGNYKIEVAHGSDHGGYTTAGFPADFNIEEIYEMNRLWEKNDLLKHVNQTGLHWINHLGHADNTWCLKMADHFIAPENITNNGSDHSFNIIYSQGCYNAAFDNRTPALSYVSDCFTETAQTISTFQVAAIGNSRYGWYMTNSTAGASQYFDRQFFDAVFGEKIQTIGEALSDSKEDNAGYILNNRYIRWCSYELNLFGDPSMNLLTDTPKIITASHPLAINVNDTCIQITSNLINGHVIAIQNNLLAGKTTTDSTGNAILRLNEITDENTPIQLILSGQNYLDHHQSVQIVDSASCLVADSIWFSTISGNKLDSLIAGTDCFFNFRLKNVGNLSSTATIVRISSPENDIIFTDSSLVINPIVPNEFMIIGNRLSGRLAVWVNDLRQINLIIGIRDTIERFNYFKTIAIKALPHISLSEFNDDQGNGNGLPDPGETIQLKFNISNQGYASTTDCYLKVTFPNELFLPGSDSTSGFRLLALSDTSISLQLKIDEIVPVSYLFKITAMLMAPNLEVLTSRDFNYSIGKPAENFETGDFSKFQWIMTGNENWQTDSLNCANGRFSAKSGLIGHNQQSRLKIEVNVMEPDSVSFDFMISSEAGYDFLSFYIDGILSGRWAGDLEWQNFSTEITPGNHVLEWVYKKDVYFSQGEDCARLDNVYFPQPPVNIVFAGSDLVSCAANPIQPQGWIHGISDFFWSTTGDGTFDDSLKTNPVYYPGGEDLSIGSTILIMNGFIGEGNMISDSLSALFVPEPEVPLKPEGVDTVCINNNLSSEFLIVEPKVNTNYFWNLEPSQAGTLFPSINKVLVTWNTYQGDVFLNVMAQNQCGESQFSETKTINLKTCSNNIGEPEFNEIKIFPNPASNELIIEFKQNIGEHSIAINDILGRTHFRTESEPSGRNHYKIDLSNFMAGVYHIIIKANKSVKTTKLIIYK